MAVRKLLRDLAAGATCVAILRDRGERYIETIYSASWVMAYVGEVSQVWEQTCSEGQEA